MRARIREYIILRSGDANHTSHGPSFGRPSMKRNTVFAAATLAVIALGCERSADRITADRVTGDLQPSAAAPASRWGPTGGSRAS